MAPYRPVRRIGAGDDVPWAGLLVKLTSGESRVLVDAGEFDAEWAGWGASPDGHLLAPMDVVRRVDGHDLLLPLCVERVDAFLDRRAAGRMPLSQGETVTLGVSLLRGIAQGESIIQGTGEWWLTDAGRPVLAVGASDRVAATTTSELLRRLGAGSPCAEALAAAAGAISGPRMSVRDLGDAEDALFALAAAEPLATAPVGPRATRDLVPADRRDAVLPEAAPSQSWTEILGRHVDADLADAVSHVTTGLWRRLRSPRRTGGRPWLLATGAAGVVLAAGMLWPTEAGGPATADPGLAGGWGPTATETPTPGPSVSATHDAGAAPVDLVAITDALLTARTSCGADRSCLAGLVDDPATEFAAGAIDLPTRDRQTTLLDDFGGVAVLRVDAVSGTPAAQLVVLMLQDGRWLLRDVHTAEQP